MTASAAERKERTIRAREKNRKKLSLEVGDLEVELGIIVSVCSSLP